MERTLLLLRTLEGGGGGFCRVETTGDGAAAHFRLRGLPPGEQLRAALLVRDEELKAMDGGPMTADATGGASLHVSLSGAFRRLPPAAAVILPRDGLSLRMAGISAAEKWLDLATVLGSAQRVIPLPEPPRVEREAYPEPEEEPSVPDVAELYGDTEVWKEERPAAVLPSVLEKAHWSEAVWPLRDFFGQYPVIESLGDAEGMIFVRVPLRKALTGLDHYALGAEVREGRLKRIAYAVPGAYALDAPPGLEGYRYRRSREGDGYWVAWETV